MSWIVSSDKRTWVQKLIGYVMKNGPVPNHIAIIMDGNRRYAKEKNIEKIQGHTHGFEKLTEVNLIKFGFCVEIMCF